MGSGKTTIGKLLAEHFNYEFHEMDHLVLNQSGFNSVSEVYEHRMSLWKESELEVCRQLSKKENQVIAASGGLSENQLNLLYFQENCKHLEIVFLHVDIMQAELRLLNSVSHSFSEIEKEKMQHNLEKIAQKRDFLNRIYASVLVDTSHIDANQAADEVIQKLKGRV
jgi:shikimate kinase